MIQGSRWAACSTSTAHRLVPARRSVPLASPSPTPPRCRGGQGSGCPAGDQARRPDQRRHRRGRWPVPVAHAERRPQAGHLRRERRRDRQDDFSSFLQRAHCRRRKKFLIVFPDEKLLQRWNLETLEREVGTRPSPIDGRIKAVAMGADSSGPALVLWGVGSKPYGVSNAWFSLIDVESLAVLRVASMVHAGSASYRGIETRSPSGGAFMVDASASEQTWPHLRASTADCFTGSGPRTPGRAVFIVCPYAAGR